MKNWKENKKNLLGEESITLIGGEERILSVTKIKGNIVLAEKCDSYFEQEYTKKEILETIEELIKWIKQ